MSFDIVKKTTTTKSRRHDRGIFSEYRFDYSKARPNRFAVEIKRGNCVVVLDPDVAAVFSTSELVNAVLRALIENMPRN